MASIQREGAIEFEGVKEPENTDKPVESEGQKKETSPESPAENKPEDGTESPAGEPKKDDKTPEQDVEKVVFNAFDKHPRWRAVQDELRELRDQNEKLRSDFKTQADTLLEKLAQKPPNEEQEKSPEWFSAIYGDDENAWGQYKDYSRKQREQVKSELLREFQPLIQAAEQSKKEKEVAEWASKEWKALETKQEVQEDLKRYNTSFDKLENEMRDLLTKFPVTDPETGNLSLTKTYELWKMTKNQQSHADPIVDEKKKIAGETMKKSSDAEPPKTVHTFGSFRGKSIYDLIN